MKIWTQDQLPLKIIKDLGMLYATDTSKAKTRYILFECPLCNKEFKATPCKVASKTITCCGTCGHSKTQKPLINPETDAKKCSKCKELKHVSEFYVNKRRKDNCDTRCKKCMDEYKENWVKTNNVDLKSKAVNSRLIKRYNITSEDYIKLLIEQDYKCKICGNTAEEGRGSSSKLSVDHCHTTGKIRGLLCQKCNTGIGLLGDTVESIQKALDYLKE